VVTDLDTAIALYEEDFEMRLVHRETIEAYAVEAVLLDVGESHVELLGSLGPESAVEEFLATAGPGLHHIAYRVTDVDSELHRLVAAGHQPLDPQPRIGIRGSRVAFLEAASTGGVMTELVEPA
jgi:methylmalonyl-CoA/ethylmalonyl-CoA epimerase